MFNQKVLYSEQFPIEQKNRKITDVFCTLFGFMFIPTMLLLSFIFWNPANYQKLNSQTDSNGQICHHSINFTNINDISEKTCVTLCPEGTSTAFIKNICLPIDQRLRNKLLTNPEVYKQQDRQQFRWTLLYTIFVALGVGLIWMVVVHCFPRKAPNIAFVGAFIVLICLGVLFLQENSGLWQTKNILKIILAITCFLISMILMTMLYCYRSESQFQGIFLEYSSKFLNQNPLTFLTIPIFHLILTLLFCIVTWQALSFSSAFGKDIGFHEGGILAVLNVLEFIWAMQFRRDAFNFCVSGAAVDWYWKGKTSCYAPFSRMFCKHFGSIVGGGLINAFFQIPTLLVELVVCHPETCCARFGTWCSNSCKYFTFLFDFIRTDAYAYINLSGIPFCNAARECKGLCDRSRLFVGSYSPMKHYRLAAHILCVGVSFLGSYFILRYRVQNFNEWHLGILICLVYACVTFFVQIHCDGAQGLQVSFLVEHELQNDYRYMQKCLPSVRKQLQNLEKKSLDGNC